jgi:hypothetical protein
LVNIIGEEATEYDEEFFLGPTTRKNRDGPAPFRRLAANVAG